MAYSPSASRVRALLAEVVNRADDGGRTQLHRAAEQGNRHSTLRMLRCGANVEARTRSTRRTPLHLAAAAGHADLLPLLITPTTLDRRDGCNLTPLQLAAKRSQWDAAAVLVAAGASPFAPHPSSCPLVLALAALPQSGAAHAAALLVEAMMRDPASAGGLAFAVSHVNAWQQTGLYCAAYRGHQELVAKLLEAGADKDATATDGSTPLYAAVYKGHAQLVPLLATPRNINLLVPETGRTALHEAAAAAPGHEGMVAALLAAGADPEAPDDQGRTTLAMAARANHMGVAALLVSALTKKWRDQQAQARALGHVTAAVALLACTPSRAARCCALLEVVLDVLGPEVAGQVCAAVQQQLLEEWERLQPPPAAHVQNEWLPQARASFMAEVLLMGWIGAVERLHAARQPLVARLQRLLLSAGTRRYRQHRTQLQQQLYKLNICLKQEQLVTKAELAAAAGREQYALKLLERFAALYLQHPPEDVFTCWSLIDRGHRQAALMTAGAAASTKRFHSAAEMQRALSFCNPRVHTTFLAAWVAARRQLQQVPQEVAGVVVAAVKAAQQQQVPVGLGGTLPSRSFYVRTGVTTQQQEQQQQQQQQSEVMKMVAHQPRQFVPAAQAAAKQQKQQDHRAHRQQLHPQRQHLRQKQQQRRQWGQRLPNKEATARRSVRRGGLVLAAASALAGAAPLLGWLLRQCQRRVSGTSA